MIFRFFFLSLPLAFSLKRKNSPLFSSSFFFPRSKKQNSFSSWLIADSAGYVCPRDRVDTVTGCCPHSSKKSSSNKATTAAAASTSTTTTTTTSPPRPFSCAGCDADAQCCSEYEHCVSCCLKPGHGAEELYKTEYRSRGR